MQVRQIYVFAGRESHIARGGMQAAGGPAGVLLAHTVRQTTHFQPVSALTLAFALIYPQLSCLPE